MKHLILIGVAGFALYASTTISAPAATTTAVQSQQSDPELAWVDEQIRAIIPARVGIANGYIDSLRDPMKFKSAPVTIGKLLPPPKLGGLSSAPVVVEEPLRLQAMMNKAVLISGKWYKVGDSVRGMNISEVKPNSVLLSGKNGQKLILFLTKQNNNIKITTK